MARAQDYPIHMGGLFRCCIQTISESLAEVSPGQTLHCRWCGEVVRLGDDQAWRWVSPQDGVTSGG